MEKSTSPRISPSPAGAAVLFQHLVVGFVHLLPVPAEAFGAQAAVWSPLSPADGTQSSEMNHRGTFLSLKGISLIKVTKITSEAHKENLTHL